MCTHTHFRHYFALWYGFLLDSSYGSWKLWRIWTYCNTIDRISPLLYQYANMETGSYSPSSQNILYWQILDTRKNNKKVSTLLLKTLSAGSQFKRDLIQCSLITTVICFHADLKQERIFLFLVQCLKRFRKRTIGDCTFFVSTLIVQLIVISQLEFKLNQIPVSLRFTFQMNPWNALWTSSISPWARLTTPSTKHFNFLQCYLTLQRCMFCFNRHLVCQYNAPPDTFLFHQFSHIKFDKNVIRLF